MFRDFVVRAPRKKQLRLTTVERDRIKARLQEILAGTAMTVGELQKALLREGLALEIQFIRRLLRETGGYIEMTSRRGTLWQRR